MMTVKYVISYKTTPLKGNESDEDYSIVTYNAIFQLERELLIATRQKLILVQGINVQVHYTTVRNLHPSTFFFLLIRRNCCI